MEVGDNKNFDVIGVAPNAVGEPLRVKHICDKKCDEEGFKFFMIRRP